MLCSQAGHQVFSFRTTPEKFENATTTGHFGFVFEENLGRENTWISWCHSFSNSSGLKRVFEKLQISVGFRPNQRNKSAFSNFCGVVRTGPENV